ncbi:MAG: flavodoxin-dependent (E)-4-hydroxy-3-methylbut-2-enyl-diphosphate synthase [Candidatus Gastranaerophilales bacterium]|nr:flavodoxin-dependent (E)-4-hydroxy-3-methylbut-2-enyl-diphosphate synthase [Candidatus Gastranaerophilales bacterium]
MITRRTTKKINIGGVEIGSDAPVSVQSMCNTDTRDVKSTVEQISRLAEAGCELVRVAVLDKQAAEAIGEIKKHIKIPLIADIHFDYRLATEAINQGVDALRLNPGNIGRREFVEKVVNLAKERQTPIRIGVNSGSLEKEFQALNLPLYEKMVLSAKKHIQILEDLDFDLIKVSLKSSNVVTMIKAYELLAQEIDYPLHLGVTEAGTIKGGLIKSAVGIGTLLYQGIGDTIRVSLTDKPEEEVYAGFEILKSLGLRKKGINFVSCPTCGRCQYDLITLAKTVEDKFKHTEKTFTLAIMGCPVNGPGEAKHADIGVAGGAGFAYIFKKGEVIAQVQENEILNILEKEIEKL